jgi:hypothetical protein
MSFAPPVTVHRYSVNVPECGFVHCLNAMQPPERQFLPEKNGRTSPATSGQLDPLLQFEPEARIVRRHEQAAVSARPSSISPSALRAEAFVRPQRKIEVPLVARSKARRSRWSVLMAATCGSVLVAVMLLQMSAPSPMPSQNQLVPPPAVPTPVQTAAPVGRSTGASPSVPVTLANKKKPVAAEPRSPVIDAPVTPPSTAGRPVAGTKYYGSLAIDSVPVSARVFINGEPIGVTPLVLTELPVGSRAVRLEADDRTPWSSTVRVVAGQQTRVNATLSPSR